MSDQIDTRSFRLARMSSLILALTLFFLVLPPIFLVGGVLGRNQLWAAGLLVLGIDAWVWLRFRPSRFTVQGSRLEVIWPLKYRYIPRESIVTARVIDRQALKREIGWGLRVGAGGIWGGFGWLWTKRRGVVQMYISRTDGFVWIERAGGRPWLLTPEEPEEFVRALVR
jgi:Bacterial PH domain